MVSPHDCVFDRLLAHQGQRLEESLGVEVFRLSAMHRRSESLLRPKGECVAVSGLMSGQGHGPIYLEDRLGYKLLWDYVVYIGQVTGQVCGGGRKRDERYAIKYRQFLLNLDARQEPTVMKEKVSLGDAAEERPRGIIRSIQNGCSNKVPTNDLYWRFLICTRDNYDDAESLLKKSLSLRRNSLSSSLSKSRMASTVLASCIWMSKRLTYIR